LYFVESCRCLLNYKSRVKYPLNNGLDRLFPCIVLCEVVIGIGNISSTFNFSDI
jgi:hypothetical protein